MAPKLTKREAKVKQVPWLTMAILKSISVRDALHKKFPKEKACNAGYLDLSSRLN